MAQKGFSSENMPHGRLLNMLQMTRKTALTYGLLHNKFDANDAAK